MVTGRTANASPSIQKPVSSKVVRTTAVTTAKLRDIDRDSRVLMLKERNRRVGFGWLAGRLFCREAFSAFAGSMIPGCFSKGQKDGESCTARSLALRAPDAHVAFVSFQQLRNNPQSQPGAGLRFCREKRFEDVGNCRTVDAGARIADCH